MAKMNVAAIRQRLLEIKMDRIQRLYAERVARKSVAVVPRQAPVVVTCEELPEYLPSGSHSRPDASLPCLR
jgi:hypothetical protein